MRHYIVPFFIPELRCPNRCIFCNQYSITGQEAVFKAPDIDKRISEWIKYMPTGSKNIEVGFFGGNFTGLDLQTQEEYLKKAAKWINLGLINGIRISTRPDYINPNVLNLLKENGVVTVELGVQSMDNETLTLSGRGHTALHVEEASKLILEHGFKLCLQMMTGLPGDTKEKTIYTAKRIVDLGASETRIYPVLVIRNTQLADLYVKGFYIPLSLDETIERCKKLILFFEKHSVKILRLGLHPSEGLCTGNDLLAGPFHPSLRELVNTAIWKDRFEEQIKPNGARKLIIEVAPNQLSAAIGHRQSNKKFLLKHFSQVEIKPNQKHYGREYSFDYS
ncbi:MAG TPA: radical SAM protein [Bacteroidales bacterium]|nr:radical SAM protein [Bacteroidales bacterium]